MTYRRGRVAITVHGDHHPDGHEPATQHCSELFKRTTVRTHMGHVRTLLLGEEYCRRLGVPFHVRVDGLTLRVKEYTAPLLDLAECIAWFGMRPAALYRRREHPRPDSFYRGALGEDLWGSIESARGIWRRVGYDYWDVVADDWEWHPSLMVRGMDFERPEECAADWETAPHVLASIRRVIEYERDLYRAAGMERPQLTLPLVGSPYDSKVSKTLGGFGWDVLKMVGPEEARRFMFATAVNPTDPLAALDAPLPPAEELNPIPYTWSWETWGSFVRSL